MRYIERERGIRERYIERERGIHGLRVRVRVREKSPCACERETERVRVIPDPLATRTALPGCLEKSLAPFG